VPGAEKIIPNLKRLVDEASARHVLLVSSADAHTPNDPEFTVFPPHCVKGTPGAQIVPEGLAANHLTIPNDASLRLPADFGNHPQIVIEKQTLDVFRNPKTAEIVEALGPEVEYVIFGVVTEYCVRCAARGLLDRGRRVFILRDAIETLKPEEGNRTLGELEALGAQLISTDQAIGMVEKRSASRVL
jgi:nicotinamidase/pyrazinamidase